MNGELYIGAAGIHSDFPDNGDCGISHLLVFFVRQGLGRRHRNAVTGMNAHGIHIFNGTDNDHVVVMVPHHLKFVFFPAQNRFFQHNLADHAGIEPCFGNNFQVFGIVSDPAAGTAESEAGPDDNGKANFRGNRPALLHVCGNAASGNAKPDFFHGMTEQVTILRLSDRRNGSSDHFNPVFFQNAQLRDLNGGI